MTVESHPSAAGLRPSGLSPVAPRWSRLALLGLALALTGCASAPPHYPSETAQKFVGKPVFALEMHWSTPYRSEQSDRGRVATWKFDQYNYAGCSVAVHTDPQDIIRSVSWTPGCGPKRPKGKKRSP